MIEAWVLVFVAMLPNGVIDTVIVDEFSRMEACYMAMDDFVVNSSMDETLAMNWEFVCLEDIREQI